MIDTLKTAARIGCAIREIARFNDAQRECLQHSGDRRVLDFFKMPSHEFTGEIAGLLGKNSDLKPFLETLQKQFLDKFRIILNPISAYKPEKLSIEKILGKEIARISNLPCQMVTIVDGGSSIHSSADADIAYNLGAALAKHGIAVVCFQTSGILQPLLNGLIKNGGLSIGVLARKSALDNHLLKVTIITPPLRSIAAMTATLSGRLLVVFRGNHDPIADDCLHAAAYKGIPSVIIDANLPKSAKSPLQSHLSIKDEEKITKTIESNLFIDPDQGHLFHADFLPVSFFAGTRFSPTHPSENTLTEFAKALWKNKFYTIGGGGPGPMATIDTELYSHAITVGICFFSTYLASNPFTVLPIVSGYEKESRDMMVLSSVASINFGGSDTTWREVDSARYYERTLINCNPLSFPTRDIRKRGSGAIYTPTSLDETIKILKKITT